MNSGAILNAINILLAALGLLERLGVNYREVIAAQEAAKAEGRELSDAERQQFIDSAQDAVDNL